MIKRHELTKLEVDLELFPVTFDECWYLLARIKPRSDPANILQMDRFLPSVTDRLLGSQS